MAVMIPFLTTTQEICVCMYSYRLSLVKPLSLAADTARLEIFLSHYFFPLNYGGDDSLLNNYTKNMCVHVFL